MDNALKPDLCVVGAGRAGALAALAAARSGERVVVIDDGLTRAESTARDFAAVLIGLAGRHAAAERLPGREQAPEPDFSRIMARARRGAAALSAELSPERLVACGIHVIRSDARFTDARSLVAGDAVIRARRFLVATGSAPVRPALPGLPDVDALTLDQLPALTRRPSHLIVLGGAQGVELAQALRLLGARVTLLCGGAFLPSCDREIAGFLERRLRLQGVSIHTGAEPLQVERRGKTGIRLTLGAGERRETIDAAHLLLSDREPRLGGLDLGQAGAGANRRIRILGEPHAATGSGGAGPSEHGVAVVRTDPALAWFGALEPFAAGGRLLRIPSSTAESAHIDDWGPGLLKLAVDRNGRVLSAAMAGGPALEHIGFWALARARGLTLADLAALSVPGAGFPALAQKAHAAFMGPRPRAGLWRRMLGRA